ncbi:MAG: metallophosphoesterase [Clostridia bacterium]|nr:metallophosphoesterase [Clostridia bacterium]
MNRQPSKAKRLLHGLMALDRADQPIQVEEIRVTCPDLPRAFDGARVAVVADLHFPDALLSVPDLARHVHALKPDAIFLPGDLTNSYTYFDKERLTALAKTLVTIAPCFAIPGNHELRLDREKRYGTILVQNGVHYMCDSYADWEKDGAVLRLFGMGYRRPAPLTVKGQPSIVLAHKPDRFRYYQNARWDLVVCGHAHGGQMRFGKTALYAPGQGFFPTYTDGVYAADGTVMVVSRGLGNSSIPWRIRNAPHLPLLILQAK